MDGSEDIAARNRRNRGGAYCEAMQQPLRNAGGGIGASSIQEHTSTRVSERVQVGIHPDIQLCRDKSRPTRTSLIVGWAELVEAHRMMAAMIMTDVESVIGLEYD